MQTKPQTRHPGLTDLVLEFLANNPMLRQMATAVALALKMQNASNPGLATHIQKEQRLPSLAEIYSRRPDRPGPGQRLTRQKSE